MELSYEETMQRIAEYEKNDPMEHKYCKEKTFPWLLDVFKGEHRLFVVPSITTIGYYYTWMAWYRKLNDTESPEVIGEAILDAFEQIRISPVDARTRTERKEDSFYLKETKCKSYRAFNKKYICCGINMNEQGIYSVSTSIASIDNQGYRDIDGVKSVKLPNNASSTDLGNAVINALRISEEYAKFQKPDPYPPKETELLCGETLTVYPPRDKHFTDMEDGSAAEIYQLYEYASSEGAEASAAFYLGIAAELDCNISEENIRKVWDEMNGSAEIFSVSVCENGVFDLRAEMRNKNVHRISYLKQIDENELLECTMEIKQPNRRKKLDERLTTMFEEFSGKITKK